jgi:iron complex outermembrane receptor protein
MFTRTTLAAAILLAMPMMLMSIAHAQQVTQTPDTAADERSGSESNASDEKLSSETLEAISVQGQFHETAAKSAMKMDVAVMDTPFSVQSYGKAFIEAIEATDISQMFAYMTGVKKAGLTGLDISFRGFKSTGDDQNSVLVDGLPGLAGRYGSPPSIALERLELVRGSMSVLYGQNQPGGFINMITKKPQHDYSTNVGFRTTAYAGHGLSLNDATGYRVDFDTTGRVDEEGTFLYRILGEYGDRDTFRDFGYDKGKYLAPSLTWNIGPMTYLNAQVEYRQNDSSFDQGLVAPNRDIRLVAPITTYYGEPGSNREEEGYTANLSFSHTFANDWQWNTAYRYVDYTSEQREFSHVSIRPDGHTLTRRARHLATDRTYSNFDTNLGMTFDTGPIAHKMSVGINGGKNETTENRLKFFNSVCPGVYCFDIDIYNPIYGQVPDFDSIPANNPATPQLLTARYLTKQNLAFYASDLISLGERWKLSVGVRNFTEDQKIVDLRDTEREPVKKKSKKSLLPMAGILFQPNSHWTIYGSYSESYVPADPNDQDINGNNPFEPLAGKQYEVGAKTEDLFDGRLSASLAVFRIDQLNLMNSFTCPFGVCYDQLGKGRSQGVEFEANIRPNEDWQLTFGYAYTDATVIASNVPVQVGAQLANAPRHTANLWSYYNLNESWSLGAGLSYIGDYQGLVPAAATPTLMPMPGYTVADLALTYKFSRYAINLKLGNIFDKTYYEGTGLTAPIQIVPGSPRNITLSFRAHF